jgi:hypothetical protein
MITEGGQKGKSRDKGGEKKGKRVGMHVFFLFYPQKTKFC